MEVSTSPNSFPDITTLFFANVENALVDVGGRTPALVIVGPVDAVDHETAREDAALADHRDEFLLQPAVVLHSSVDELQPHVVNALVIGHARSRRTHRLKQAQHMRQVLVGQRHDVLALHVHRAVDHPHQVVPVGDPRASREIIPQRPSDSLCVVPYHKCEISNCARPKHNLLELSDMCTHRTRSAQDLADRIHLILDGTVVRNRLAPRPRAPFLDLFVEAPDG